MNEAQRKAPADRCFGNHCQKTPEQQRAEEKVKKILMAARHEKEMKRSEELRKQDAIEKGISPGRRKDANRELSRLRERHRCGLAGLLEPIKRHVGRGDLSPSVLQVLIERVEGQRTRNELSQQEIMDLEGAKAFLKAFLLEQAK